MPKPLDDGEFCDWTITCVKCGRRSVLVLPETAKRAWCKFCGTVRNLVDIEDVDDDFEDEDD